MEKPIEKWIARKAKQMTRYEIFLKTTAGKLTWTQAAEVLGITPRHMRRLRAEYQEYRKSESRCLKRVREWKPTG